MRTTRAKILFAVFGALFLLLAGCAAPKLSVSSPVGGVESIQTIALAPNGGVLADAVGLGLLKFGFRVFDAAQVSSLMVRMNLNEVEVLEPQNLQRLKGQGIDAVLQVRVVAGYDGRPTSATVKLVSANSGQLLAGATWQNGSGGASGSPMDRDARVDIVVAADQIAEGIAKVVPRR